MTVQAPFQYFGGKSKVVEIVWARFGDVPNYVEPFFGSGAVTLARPHPDPWTRTETVNDIDSYLANFWRATKREPERVAELMNWPVNETDLEARHKWLVTAVRKREHAERMRDDPDYYDAKIAAYWCWGLCQWIGSGWCAGEWHGRGNPDNDGTGINIRDEQRGGKRPSLGCDRGVSRRLPHLGDAGMGVHRQLPHLGNAGMGVHRQLPHLGNAGMGEEARRLVVLTEWMQAIRDRLRSVRVCCGDWARVCGHTPTIKHGTTGVFLDPPYAAEAGRDMNIYAHDSGTVAHSVREWAIENGRNPDMRIALCGYEGEHVMPQDWECVPWKAHGGYGTQGGNGDYVNKYRERIWFSPHCIREDHLFMTGSGE